MKLNILFMGTPDFAVFSLSALKEKTEHNIVGVVTREDKPRGRGMQMQFTPVKEYALANGIPVFTPSTLKGEEFAKTLDELNPDLIVVTAYGKILPKNVLDHPKYGCVNVHGSLLPKYRGAAPMQRAVIDGETETGICTMFMEEGLDTGDILVSAKCPIGEDDDFEVIHDRLGALSQNVLLETLKEIENGTLHPQKQDDAKSTYAKKIEKEECRIDWNKTVKEIHDQVRGTSPFPLSYTTCNGKLLKIVKTKKTDLKKQGDAGTAFAEKKRFFVNCSDGVLEILDVVPEGKKRMSAADYLNGVHNTVTIDGNV